MKGRHVAALGLGLAGIGLVFGCASFDRAAVERDQDRTCATLAKIRAIELETGTLPDAGEAGQSAK